MVTHRTWKCQTKCQLFNVVDPQPVAEIAQDPALHWEPVKLGEGAKGPTICYFTCLRVIEHRDGQPLDELWLLLRKNIDGEIRAMLRSAPLDISFEELLRVSQMRWTIEQLFQEDKDFLQGGQTPEGSFWKDKVLDESPVIRFSSFSMSTISLFSPWVAH